MPSLHYKIITSRYYPPSSSYQCDYFSSMIKNKVDSYFLVNLDSNGYVDKWTFKNSIAKAACIPIDTIIDIYFYSITYIDEYKNYTSCGGSTYSNIYSYEGDTRIY